MNSSLSVALQEKLGPLASAFHRQVCAAGGAGDSVELVALGAALLMRETLDGHSCLTLDELEARASESGISPLHASDLQSALSSHPWVSTSSTANSTPLVFENGRLYLRRYREAEVRLAQAIRERVAAGAMDDTLPALAARFREIFPATEETDWQAVAVAACLRSRIALITGGPGTGKTTTVARLLALLLEQDPDVRIALAAPTGKAATRLGEAIRQTWDGMGVDASVRERLTSTGQTVHRLLGYWPKEDRFRHDASDPLECDVLIVDEASMVPLLLMDTLFTAVRPDARIILLGDHNQLASVEAGAVLADLVSASGALQRPHGAALARAYETLSGRTLPSHADESPLRDVVVRLLKSHRFDDTKGIGALARAIRDGDAESALAVLAEGDETVVRAASSSRGDGWLKEVTDGSNPVFGATTPDEALDALARMRVLCATNVGPAGTEALTPRIEQKLRDRGHAAVGRYYRGRPLLLTRNDYALGLFNGDIGVVWDELDDEGATVQRAFIANPGLGEVAKGFPLPQLPEAVTAWAMTVHKSQGSEFETVVVVLPDSDVAVLGRELLYTAVTRAKKRVIVVGPDETLRIAVARTARRGSGLAARLAQ